VRVWREFKSIGALYPPLSMCLIPDNVDNRQRLAKIEELIAKNGKIMKLQGKNTSEDDQNNILRIFRTERDKQYDEILEECQEFIDEIKANIRNKKTAQEEVEEMHEVLDGLRRWLDKVKSIDWIEKPAAAIRVEKLLEKCQDSMDKFTELSHPKKNTHIN
jgi:succinate dehydrogenase/fumarate reductase flavoprotein subunit